MPFTLSHAAAVLPLIRTDGTGRGRLVPSMLIAGTFAPDMTYYAASVLSGAMEYGDVTHSFWGVLTVDVVVAWALVGLWLLVREPLVALLPPSRQHRVAALLHCGAPRARVRPSTVAWWYLSAALGSLTHVVWDAFTHLDRWGMRVFPVLGEEIAGSPLYWYLQYGGSAVAAVVIGGFVLRGLRRGAGVGAGARAGAGEGPGAGASGVAGSGLDGGFAGVPGKGVDGRPSGVGGGELEGRPPGMSGNGPKGRPSGVPVGVPVLSGRDRWLACAVIGGITVLAAVQRATRWWEQWSSVAKPYELIPTLCFGGGAGLLVGVVWYAVTVRVWRPARLGGERGDAGERRVGVRR
ncbi:DUF4184 family protein [Streptomyces sp. NPDC059477]|uniref:DUF4184 family protein n=1 Tax=Streptomyces sp. NPDC059477 TaxID=3346847 RepID=UPI00369AD5E6